MSLADRLRKVASKVEAVTASKGDPLPKKMKEELGYADLSLSAFTYYYNRGNWKLQVELQFHGGGMSIRISIAPKGRGSADKIEVNVEMGDNYDMVYSGTHRNFLDAAAATSSVVKSLARIAEHFEG